MYKITVDSDNLTYYQDKLQYVKYQEKNDLMLLCDKSEAQGILSHDGSEIYTLNSEYHLKELYKLCTIEIVNEDVIINQMAETIKTLTEQNNALIQGAMLAAGGE